MTKGKRVDVSSTWEISVHSKNRKRKMNYHMMYRNVSVRKIIRTVNVKGESIVKGGKCIMEKMSPRPRTVTFTITEVLSPVTYKLQLPRSWKIHNTFHASLLSPYHENEIHGQNFPSPPPDLIDNEEHYEIEKIIHHKGTLSRRQYLV